MHVLTPADIRGKPEYEADRPEFRRRIMALKQRRRVLVGDHCSVHFENRDTMRYQVQEMLRAENSWGRPGAVEDELSAYNPLIPQPGELSATIMFEYATAEERRVQLPRLAGRGVDPVEVEHPERRVAGRLHLGHQNPRA